MSALTPAPAVVAEWRGMTVVDSDGSKIGKLDEIYLDQETKRPEWALINTGLFGTKSSFMPLAGASAADDQVQTTFTKDQVKDAPSIDTDGQLSPEEEATLYEHYGLTHDSGQARLHRYVSTEQDQQIETVDGKDSPARGIDGEHGRDAGV